MFKLTVFGNIIDLMVQKLCVQAEMKPNHFVSVCSRLSSLSGVDKNNYLSVS